MAGSPWRLLRSGAGEGDYNMAVDDVLMESVRSGGAPTLRLYSWSRPTLSFGRNQPAHGQYDVDELTDAGVAMVRRPTGGRAVLHHLEITYSVAAPDKTFGSARGAYLEINRVLLDAMQALGAAAEIYAGEGATPALSSDPCFAEPAAGEVVASGRKLIGSAQLRLDHVLLQQGCLPLRRSPLLDTLSPTTAANLDGSAAYLDLVTTRPVGTEVIEEAIALGWSKLIAPPEPDTLSAAEEARVTDRRQLYREQGWTWRR